MSYYNTYPNPTMNTATCAWCGTETFSWLAECFNCATCGGGTFKLTADEADDGDGKKIRRVEVKAEYAYTEGDIQEQLRAEYEGETNRQHQEARRRKRN